MKIAILTMHRVVNYGSFMQAFAMKRTLEGLGHDVEFRDFLPGPPRHRGNNAVVAPRNLLKKLPGKLARLGSALEKARFKSDLQAMFENTVWPLLGVPSALNTSLKADAFVIGSDEVFNYTQNHSFGYVRCLFGHDIDAPLIVAYAASAGYANAEDAVADDMVEELGSGLKRMAHIGVRDENTRRLVEHCVGHPVDMVIDPTLIYDFEPHIPAASPVAPGYVLVYAYEGRMDAPDEVEAVKSYARARGLRTVSVGGFQPWCDQNLVLSPFEVLALFRDADAVVTDTFHGSIFAMKARRNFATLIRTKSEWGSNSNKVGFLLKQFGLESRVAGRAQDLASVLDVPVPYSAFEDRLVEWQTRSRNFLQGIFGAR